ncbi:sodium- and chloride-dependent glycine transporter 2-like [Haliotis rubra]|uniref:sodium- and chloride-dependent glycine transporter 2-like n=1 Tax=Haliotis rubra TaxID=36100 RepID=UPI001EE5FB94|nr:sodium- and chloride-dependent glycine transporter 2-like [Haliotis rubra]XP_046543833.1 sodium- and chloride-dependent glycine transporter 2-like [Haliotis rubra]XP_046543834.1 sodium- and chloride-dependent glycine transporter 2-like [Haliotis rubra]
MSKEEPAERAQWGRQLEFIFTLIGYAVGLGNIWRFPYLCYKNGGGAFLIPYIICLIFIGIPIFGLEVAFGQFGGKGPISIWYINPAMKGIGYAGVLVSVVISIYYDVIIAWGLYYFFASMTDEVPWSKCSQCECLNFGKNVTPGYDNATGINCTGWTGDPKSSSEIYYKEVVLQQTASIAETGEINWQVMLCNLLAWLIVLIVLARGIKSLGKVVYFTATFPYILLTVLLIRGAMLDGAIDGVTFYLTPKWDRLADATVWSDAAVQIFFSLSACQGGLVAMSSYNRFSNNVLRDSIMIPVINCLTSFYAGFVVFSTLGYMANIRGVPVANVTTGGTGLAFIAYPEALSNMPITPLWSILFFLMLCTLGFSSQFSIVETIMTAMIDEFPQYISTTKRKLLFRSCVCLGAFLLGLPIVTQSGPYLLDLVDSYILGFPTLFIALFELIAISYIYGYSSFAKDVEAMVGRKPYIYFTVCWLVISPLLILGVIVFKGIQYEPLTAKGEPVFAEVIGWFIAMSPVAIIVIAFLWYTCPSGLWQRLLELNMHTDEWRQRRNLSTFTHLHVPTAGRTNLGFTTESEPANGRYSMDEKPSLSKDGGTDSNIGHQDSGYVPYFVDPDKFLAGHERQSTYEEESTKF